MTTLNLYNSLTINERTKIQFDPRSNTNMKLAEKFWCNLLEIDETADGKNINDLLKSYYEVDLNFLKTHFESEEDIFGYLSEGWVDQIKNNITFFDSYLYEIDLDFEKIDFSKVPFFSFFKPYVREFYYSFLNKELKNITTDLTYSAINEILKHLIDLLYEISYKTLVLEINSLRLSKKLNGETSEKRYHSFMDLLENDNTYKENFIKEYSVLFRLISTKIINYKNHLSEIFSRYEADKLILEKELKIDTSSKISHIHLGSGDTHKQGRSVSILELSNGQKIVYKPRSLGIDQEFQLFIKWINSNEKNSKKLKTIKILDKKTYGWSEFVPFENCNQKEDLSKFYDRMGQLLGVLHVLNATDFHYENLIANGPQPVLIDLESLFHHTISSNHDMTKSPVLNKSLQLINDSVISTGLIPNRTIKSEEFNFDLSGIGNSLDNQELPFKTSVVSNPYTDEVVIEKKNSILVPGKNNPQLNGDPSIEIGQYLENVVQGFSTTYNYLLNNKSVLKNKINNFSEKESRKIFRDTMKYWKLMNLSFHPDFMRNQIDREILLNRLRVNKGELLERAVDYEIKDILNGDIPYFTSTPDSKDILTSDGQIIKDFYYKDGLSLSFEKIDRLNENDLKNQLNIIRATISAVYSEKDIKLLQFNSQNRTENVKENLLEKSKEIADILIESAVKYEDEDGLEFCWTSMVTKGGNESNWVYSITGPGLYDGNPGISLYFSYLYTITGEDKYKSAANAAIRPIIKILPDLVEPSNVNLGGYLGIGGIIYTLHHLSNTLENPELMEMAKTYAKLFEKFIQQDVVYDLIGGSAGALMTLLNLYEEEKEEWMIDLGQKLVDHLIDNAVKKEQGIAWVPFNDFKNEPYIGFSHGNAGIIAALSRFNNFFPSAKTENAIHSALHYENSYFSEEKNNWYSSHLNKYLLAWCHGSPGILLSRCILMENGFNDKEVSIDLLNAFQSTIESQTGKNYSLCHGDLGLIDILITASKKTNSFSKDDLIKINDIKTKILNSIFSNNQVQADINSVGLLNGITSIGYGLIRIFDSSKVPSVLVLEKPIR